MLHCNDWMWYQDYSIRHLNTSGARFSLMTLDYGCLSGTVSSTEVNESISWCITGDYCSQPYYNGIIMTKNSYIYQPSTVLYRWFTVNNIQYFSACTAAVLWVTKDWNHLHTQAHFQHFQLINPLICLCFITGSILAPYHKKTCWFEVSQKPNTSH